MSIETNFTSEDTVQKAYEHGRAAYYLETCGRLDNPYLRGSHQYKAWDEGFMDAYEAEQ